ncbi:hypothetical protein LC612_03305 [Nostoc sp. CHAB 5834]|nr:hypothetical protein [Nostoc sp. CHAB 5834]
MSDRFIYTNLNNRGGGNDRLVGRSGTDNLTGGSGNDTFQFNSISDSPAGSSRDVIQVMRWD